MAETKEQLVEENEALRARVRELEAEVKSSNRPRVFDRQTSDTLRDLPTEAIDQASACCVRFHSLPSNRHAFSGTLSRGSPKRSSRAIRRRTKRIPATWR